MKNTILFLVSAFMFMLNVNAQSTSPTGTETPCFINSSNDAHIYVDGLHYVGKNIDGQNAVLQIYNNNCELLDTPVTIPWYASTYESFFLPIKMVESNGNIYIVASPNLDEMAVFKYNIATQTLDILNRFSVQNEGIQLLTVKDGNVFIAVAAVSTNFTVAVAADWANPLPGSYDVAIGNIQSFIYKMNDDMSSPGLLKHLKNSSFDYFPVRDGIDRLDDGSLLTCFSRDSQSGDNYKDTYFVQLNSNTGDVIQSKNYDGPVRMFQNVSDNNFIITYPDFYYEVPGGGSGTYVEQNSVSLIDNSWNQIMNSGRISYGDSRPYNVHITDNSFIIECGTSNFGLSQVDDIQSWLYIHLRKDNLQRKVVHAGELAERSQDITEQLALFNKFNFTDEGYDGLGYYDEVPLWEIDNSIVRIADIDLEPVGSSGFKIPLYHRNTPIPTSTFTPQLGDDGVAVYMNQKLVNGIKVASDQFDSVLAINDNSGPVSNWLGEIIDVSYVDGGEPSGWQSWADYAQYELGNVQVTQSGDYFVDIAIYDYDVEELFMNSSPAITNTKFQRVYLINEEDLGTSDIAFNDLVLYPNPVSNNLFINSPSNNITSVSVIDVMGRIVNQSFDESGIEEIQFSGLQAGMYFVTVSDGNNSTTKKIMKK